MFIPIKLDIKLAVVIKLIEGDIQILFTIGL